MWSLTAEGFLTLTCIFEMLSLDPSRPPTPAFLGTTTQLSSLLLSSRKLRADVAPTPSESLSLSPGLNLPCLFILCECVCVCRCSLCECVQAFRCCGTSLDVRRRPVGVRSLIPPCGFEPGCEARRQAVSPADPSHQPAGPVREESK